MSPLLRTITAQDHKTCASVWKCDVPADAMVLEVGESGHVELPSVLPTKTIIVLVAPGVASSVTWWADAATTEAKIILCIAEKSTLQCVLVSPKNHLGLSIHVQTKIQAHAHVSCLGLLLSPASHFIMRSELCGDAATSNIQTLLYARGQEAQTCDVRNVFLASHGGGQITMKAVAEEQAKLTMHGLIEIAEQGSGTDTFLTQEVLMLDPAAQVHTVPGLEIRTNDVKASHSATVSRITPEDLFYFQSRGIDELQARTMFIEGFLGQVFEAVPNDDLRARLNQAVAAKFSVR
jgi:SUF system FeS cluster assembly, SufBD